MSTSPGSGPPAIEARALVQRFGDVAALDGLDLTAPSGVVTAVLGPNGAGKTTFVRAVATLSRPEAGTLHVGGVDVLAEPKTVRRRIGLAGQSAAVEEALTGRENLVMVGRWFGHTKADARAAADAVLRQLSLTDAADRLVKTWSGGMRRRLDLGASLVGAPKLLLLDEPTTGLDPRTRIELWDAIRALVATGTDVLLTTQYLEEADQLADHVVIIDHGKAIADGTPGQLKAQAGSDVLEVRVRHSDQLALATEVLGVGEAKVDEPARRVTVPAGGGADDLVVAVRALADRDVELEDISLRRPTLDEVFLALTGAAPEGAATTSNGAPT